MRVKVSNGISSESTNQIHSPKFCILLGCVCAKVLSKELRNLKFLLFFLCFFFFVCLFVCLSVWGFFFLGGGVLFGTFNNVVNEEF